MTKNVITIYICMYKCDVSMIKVLHHLVLKQNIGRNQQNIGCNEQNIGCNQSILNHEVLNIMHHDVSTCFVVNMGLLLL